MNHSLDTIWSVDKHVRFRKMLDEGVLIHQEKAEAIVLNLTGITFLELCDGRTSTADIIDAMTGRFAVEAEQLQQDLLPFIESLAEQGILHPDSAADGGAGQ